MGSDPRTFWLGFDEQGMVQDCANLVLRWIRPDYMGEVSRLYHAYEKGEFDKKGIVETSLRGDGNLEHRKLVTSYPYEWPASMYKDAVLFHLQLFLDLDAHGLTLKDALPNNILFENTRPVFVDFLSLVFPQRLGEERWLAADAYADARFAVIDRMLLPYLMLPLLSFAKGDPTVARDLLSTRSCNTDGRPPSWIEVLYTPSRWSRHALRRYPGVLPVFYKLASLKRSLRSLAGAEFRTMIQELIDITSGIDVTPPVSGYSSYYDEKKEVLSLRDHAGFLPKQKAVHTILDREKPETVLDIGANTGWYSSLAAGLGARVIAMEQDESCIDILYRKAKKKGSAILPLKIAFSELERQIHGSGAFAKDYPERGIGSNPLYRPAIGRLQADLVLVLGLLHHLVLGEGRTLNEVLDRLAKLATKILVLEFVGLDDDKIVDEPGFFPNIHKFDAASYNLEATIRAGRLHYGSVEVMNSHPDSRKILVFKK